VASLNQKPKQQTQMTDFNLNQIEILKKYGIFDQIQALINKSIKKPATKENNLKNIKQIINSKIEQLKWENEVSQRSSYHLDRYLFGIPQGAQFEDLRKESARLTMELDFPGYSIGGVANGGEPEEMMYSQVLAQTQILEDYKPRHLLGVGTPKDIVQMVARGIDMFDCVYPTRNARHGTLFFKAGENSYTQEHIKNRKFEFDFEPINRDSKIFELRTYTKAYLHHLFRSEELLASRLATLHNLEFYLNLMAKIRNSIENDTFKDWWQEYRQVNS
jgi:queuine tRNA-ribosyltransferase